jgi:cytochrome c
MDFDVNYLDHPEIDEEMWNYWQNKLQESKPELENKDVFDIENFINSWERQDDRYHDDKKD